MEDLPKSRELLHKLTVEEKILLLGGSMLPSGPEASGNVYGIERLELPPLKFADGPIGVHWWTKASTCYPATIALAASFDSSMAKLYGASLADDCRAVGVHVLLAPGVNLYRSPLCGRNFEYFGEDPELAGQMAAAFIDGVQSKGVAATIKHFACNNQEYDRHGISSDVDERTLREVYLRPFEIAVAQARVACVMTAYGLVNGQHCSENAWLIDEVLRGDWGFKGFVISDWTSVHSTVQTLNGGLDLEMPWGKFLNTERILPALANGVVSPERLDAAVRHRLELMERFGWLDPSHIQTDSDLPTRDRDTEAVALEAARRGIVLLKNQNGLLPAPPQQTRKIAVLGHHAGVPVLSGGGSAYTTPHESLTLMDALKTVYGDRTEVTFHRCLDPWRGKAAFENSQFQTQDGTPGLRARYFNNSRFEGNPVHEEVVAKLDTFLGERRPSPEVNAPLFSAEFDGTLTIPSEDPMDFYVTSEDAYLTVTVGGSILFQRQRGPARVTRSLPPGTYSVTVRMEQSQTGYLAFRFGYEPAENARVNYEAALQAARDADLVIVAAGFVTETEGESHDRDFELDPRSVQLIRDAAAAAPGRTVPVLYIGGAVQTNPWLDEVSACLCLWYPGQNGTLAAAEIIAGITNPSGRLPFTWERELPDRGSFTCYHDEDGDRRVAYLDGVFTGYRWFDREGIVPRFPFGFGLSYTSFLCENLRLGADRMEADASLEVSFEIINTGNRAGAEVGLVFVGEEEPTLPRPPKELKAFTRVNLEAGERKTVTFQLSARAFAHWSNQEKAWQISPGDYSISAGSNAGNLPLRGTVHHGGAVLGLR